MTVIDQFEGEHRDKLLQMAALIRESAPEASEKISYQIPTFTLRGNLVHFAGFTHHIGFYPGAAGVSNFQDELGDYVHAKGTIQFPLGKPLPDDLIRRITALRVQQNSTGHKH